MDSLSKPQVATPTATEAVIVGIIDDDEGARDALSFQLCTAGFQVVSHDSAESFLGAPWSDKFDCILVDICLPKMNGLQLMAEIKRLTPFVSIIFITGQGDMSIGVEAMKNGAFDCLEKPVDDRALLEVIERGAAQSRLNRSEHSRRLELKTRECTLTPREREVFALITTGLLNKEVGAKLGPTERTVKTHRGRVMKKMGANSLADLVRMSEILKLHASRGKDLG